MKVVSIVLSVISILSILSTLICGMWIRTNSAKITDIASSTTFHANLAIFTVVVTLIALVLGMIRK